MVSIRKKTLLFSSFAYIYIPVIIFLLGFLKLYIAAAVILALGFVGVRVIKHINSLEKENKDDDRIKLNPIFFVFALLFLLFIGYMAGWGRWAKQSYDWNKHNAVLSDLIEKEWPVYYENEDEKSMLTYYIGQYMVPALGGKIAGMITDKRIPTVKAVPGIVTFIGATSLAHADWIYDGRYDSEISLAFRVAEIIQYFWTEIGLILTWMNILLFLKNTSIIAHCAELFMLAFFAVPQSIVEILVYFIYGIDCLYTNYIDAANSTILLQYTGNYICFSFVFIQLIVPWIVVMLFLNYREQLRMYLFYMLPMLLFAPLPFIGLVPLAGGYAIYILCRDKNILNWIKTVFCIENITCLLSLGTVLVLYYYGNVFQEKPALSGFTVTDYTGYFGLYIIFVGVNVLIYAGFLFKDNKKNILYYLAIGVLVILPLFHMGLYNDLVMRSSIPSLLVLQCLLTRYMIETFPKVKVKKALLPWVMYAAFIAIIINASTYPIDYFFDRTVNEKYTKVAVLHTYETMEHFANRKYFDLSEDERTALFKQEHPGYKFEQDFSEDLIFNYYSYDLEDNVFYNYLARKKL